MGEVLKRLTATHGIERALLERKWVCFNIADHAWDAVFLVGRFIRMVRQVSRVHFVAEQFEQSKQQSVTGADIKHPASPPEGVRDVAESIDGSTERVIEAGDIPVVQLARIALLDCELLDLILGKRV